MKKRLISIIIVLCMLLTLMPNVAVAATDRTGTGTVGLIKSAPSDKITATIKGDGLGGTRTGETLQEIVQGVLVTWNNAGANYNEGSFTSLTITQGEMTRADWEYLKALSNLKTFKVEAGVTSVADIPDGTSGTPVFPTTIQTVNIPQAIKIGANAFNGCAALASAILPAATNIGSSAFNGCTALAELTLGATPPAVGTDAFKDCKAGTLYVPIAGQAAYDAVTADGNTSGDSKWYGWNITSPITIKIGDVGTAVNGDSLQNAIGNTAIDSIKKLTITAGTVTEADWIWFGGITKNYEGTTLSTKPVLTALTDFTIDATVVSVADIPNGVSGAPVFHKTIKTVTIPQSIKIGNSAFEVCTSLASANFPAATAIGACAFKGCANTNFKTVSFPAVTSIGEDAFNYCDKLVTATFPAATTIGKSAFTYCGQLTAASFPKVTDIGNNAFQDCSSLASATFPAATIIRPQAFYRCRTLTLAENSFPAATNIEMNAFKGCAALTSASFPAATTIDANAFQGCAALASVSFPAATNIYANAFADCAALASVSLPAVDNIAEYVFKNCTFLAELKLGATPPTSMFAIAFNGCTATGKKLVLVGTDGTTELTGAALTTAQENYDKVKDGLSGSTDYDGLWYGWKVRDAVTTTTEVTPAVTIDYTAEKFTNFVSGGSYTVNGTGVTLDGTTLAIDSGYLGTTISIVKKGDGTTTVDSAAQTLSIPARAAAPTLVPTQPTVIGGNGSIPMTSVHKYSADGGGSWNSATGTVSLPAGSYLVRTKATASAFESTSQTIVIIAYVAPQETTPNIAIDYAAEKFTNFVSGGSYTVNGTSVPIVGTELAIDSRCLGTTISIVKKGNGTTTVDSAAQTLIVPARAAAPTSGSFTVTRPSKGGSNGEISGITAAMQYSTDSGATWNDGSGTALTGITDGTVYTIRFKATAGAFASGNVAVTVASKSDATITFANGSSTYNGLAQIHENATADVAGNITYTYAEKAGSTLTGNKPQNAGSYTVTATLDTATHFGSKTVDFTITRAPLSIKAEDKTINAGQPKPAYTVVFTGIVNNQKVTGVTFSDDAADTATKGSFTITPAGAIVSGGNDNYDISYKIGTLTINVDVAVIESAVAAATTVKSGIAVNEGTPSTVAKGTKFVNGAAMNALNGAIQTATNAKLTVKTAAQASAAAAALDSAVNAFKAAIKVGTYVPSTGGGGGFVPPLTTEIPQGGTITGDNISRLIQGRNKLTVKGSNGAKLLFDTDALRGIGSKSDGNIRFDIKDVSGDYQTTHEGKTVFSLSVTSGSKTISEFGGNVTVTLPYILKDGENPEDVTVWLLKEDGTMTEVPAVYDAKTGLATFVTGHFSKYVVGTDKGFTNPFTDVNEGDWFYGAVKFAVENALFSGVSETEFAPNGAMTRAMFWTVLARMDGKDVTGGATWYEKAQAWAVEKGLSDGTNPDDTITREQLVTTLWRYAKLKGYDVSVGEDTNILSYSDFDQISAYAIPALQWACGADVIEGDGELLSPKDTATRAQVAVVFMRFLQQTVK